jgi:hypothetical protein
MSQPFDSIKKPCSEIRWGGTGRDIIIDGSSDSNARSRPSAYTQRGGHGRSKLHLSESLATLSAETCFDRILISAFIILAG